MSTSELKLSPAFGRYAVQNKFPVKQSYIKITATLWFKVAPLKLELNTKLSTIKIVHSSRAA